MGQNTTTGVIQALLAGANAKEVSAMEVTADVSEEPQTTSAESTESTKTAGPL